MSTADSLEQWLSIFRRSAKAGRLAHAYLVCGNPEGVARTYADQVASYLLCTATEGRPCGICKSCIRVPAGRHPDVFHIEPEKKSRVIGVEAMRTFIRNLQQSAYEGDWKIGLMLHADRLNENAANAFLKTLEEPPPRTLMLLLTDSPQTMLRTVISRCQRVNLPEPERKKTEDWTPVVDGILQTSLSNDPLVHAACAHRLNDLLDETKTRILAEEKKRAKDTEAEEEVLDARAEARLKKVRAAIFQSLLHWQRDLLLLVNGCDEGLLFHAEHIEVLRGQAAQLDVATAFRRVRAIQEMDTRLARISRPALPVLESGFARMGLS
ncbi:MAG: hypothetical protein PHP44_03195 [Kiritimatiellae bacterium]|nr:hypothetical protein [Kiritimatiellia bacterium]